MTTAYRCPICQNPLERNNNSLVCIEKHCFDYAKEGYVNLIPVQQKRSKAPGDNAEMIQARRRFLGAGHYSNFLENIAKALQAQVNPNGKSLLDIGCGDGWYSTKLSQRFEIRELHAIDISKAAMKYTAKNKKDIYASVASAYALPYFDESFDIALNVFSPLDTKESYRVLKPKALLIIVGPGPNHLQELAELVYDEFKSHEQDTSTLDGFEELSNEVHALKLSLKGDELSDLLAMTPYYWSCSKEKQQEISALKNLSVKAEFSIRCYKRLM